MIQKIKTNKRLWASLSVMGFVASVVGLLNPRMYEVAEPIALVPGSIAQDIMTIPAVVVLFWLSIRTKENDFKKQIVGLGLVGYLCYAYGLYTIGRLYTPLFLGYMAIFGLSFFTLVYSLTMIDKGKLKGLTIPPRLKNFSVGLAYLQPIVFYPLWTMMLLSQIRSGKNVDFISVFIVDLCFVMPAFMIAGVLAKKGNPFGYVSLTALFILAFVELAPLGVGELIKPNYGMSIDPYFMVMFSVLSLLFLITGILNLRALGIAKLQENRSQKTSSPTI